MNRRHWKELRTCVDNLLTLYGQTEFNVVEPSAHDRQQIETFIRFKLLTLKKGKGPQKSIEAKAPNYNLP